MASPFHWNIEASLEGDGLILIFSFSHSFSLKGSISGMSKISNISNIPTYKNFDKALVKEAASGRWDAIFQALAPSLKSAQAHAGKHVPCPVHGGEDGFRLFPDYPLRGNGICNTCGAKSDGLQMLMWVNGWSFPQAIKEVASFLGLTSAMQFRSSLGESAVLGERANPSEQSRHADREFEPNNATVTLKGTVTFMGSYELNGKGNTYAIKVIDEHGAERTVLGVDLKRATQAADVRVGDSVFVRKVGTRPVALPNGRKVMKTVWDVVRCGSSVNRIETNTKTHTNDKRADAIQKLWDSGKVLTNDHESMNTAVGRYLLRRGMDLSRFYLNNDPNLNTQGINGELRFLSHAFYRNEETGVTETYPAMLAAIRDLEGKLITVHRTFLTNDGFKAPVKTPKKLMALPEGVTMTGSAIHLGMPHDVLCVAEGIETALSVQVATGYPCWAAVSAQGLQDVLIPKGVRTVLIFADKDRSGTGQHAAEVLRARLAKDGLLAVILKPENEIPTDAKGVDWNDVLQAHGVEGFPIRTT